MKSRVSHLRRGFLLLALCATGCNSDSSSMVRRLTQATSLLVTIVRPDQLTVEGQSSLRAVIEAAELRGMRWPDFRDYRKEVTRFYEAYSYGLAWVRDMQPTSQARAAIGLLLKADEKGLSADDYDGPRWADRLRSEERRVGKGCRSRGSADY